MGRASHNLCVFGHPIVLPRETVFVARLLVSEINIYALLQNESA